MRIKFIKMLFWIIKARIYNLIIWYYLLTGNREKVMEKFNKYSEEWSRVFVYNR